MSDSQELEKSIEKSIVDTISKDGKIEVVFTRLTGQLLTPDSPSLKKKHFSGTIHAPAIYVEQKKKAGLINVSNMIVTVNRTQMSIHVLTDDTDPYCAEIVGSLELHPEFKKLGINDSGKKYAPTELADLLKLNRHLFPKIAENMDVVAKLKNFTAKVESDIEKSSDTRGNKKELRAQVVTSNIPQGFTLSLPIFKGEEACEVGVELEVNENLQITLFSQDASQIIETQKNQIIDYQINKIDSLFDGLALIIEC
jgi:hypothetical protein